MRCAHLTILATAILTAAILTTAMRTKVLNAVRYAHRVLGVRPNVTVLDQNYMQFEWFVARAKRQPYFAGLNFPGAAYGTRHGDG